MVKSLKHIERESKDHDIYNKIQHLYNSNADLTLDNCCSQVGVSRFTYYRICKKYNLDRCTTTKGNKNSSNSDSSKLTPSEKSFFDNLEVGSDDDSGETTYDMSRINQFRSQVDNFNKDKI